VLDQRFWLNAGENEVAVPLPAAAVNTLELTADEGVYLQAIAVVPIVDG
jgi:hypothetical protein